MKRTIRIGFDIIDLNQDAKEDQKGIEESSKLRKFSSTLRWSSMHFISVNDLIEEEIKHGIAPERIVSTIMAWLFHRNLYVYSHSDHRWFFHVSFYLISSFTFFWCWSGVARLLSMQVNWSTYLIDVHLFLFSIDMFSYTWRSCRSVNMVTFVNDISWSECW